MNLFWRVPKVKKNNFMGKLEELLSSVPEVDRKEMLYDYEEHFTVGLEDGRTEAEIVNELGDPHSIARDLLSEYKLTRVDHQKQGSNTVNIMLAAIMMGFLNLVFVLGPALGIFGVYIGLVAASFILIISPLAIIGSVIFNGLEDLAIVFFLSLITCGLGILLGIGMLKMGKFLSKTFLKYMNFNKKVIYGGKGVKAA